MRNDLLVNLTLAALMTLPAAVFLGCESSDPVAIEGSQIILTATPNPIDLLVDPTGTSMIEARLISDTGVPQSDAQVLFFITNGSGQVSPSEDTTDDDGLASATLKATTPGSSVTVNAQSGSITANRQVSVTEGTPTIHFLTSSDAVIDTLCSDDILLTGSLTGTGGAIANQPVTFQVVSSKVNGQAADPPLAGGFTPPSTLTDSNGAYSVSFLINQQQCADSCVGTDTCEIVVQAEAATLDSTPVTITDNL